MSTTPGKGRADYYEGGDWNTVCYQCGRKRKASMMRRHWQGYYVCPEHWEPRQPQDFVRGLPDVQTPPWVQPMPADVFVEFCTPCGVTAICDYAVASCAIANYIAPTFNFGLCNLERGCTPNGITALPDMAVASCSINGTTLVLGSTNLS